MYNVSTWKIAVKSYLCPDNFLQQIADSETE